MCDPSFWPRLLKRPPTQCVRQPRQREYACKCCSTRTRDPPPANPPLVVRPTVLASVVEAAADSMRPTAETKGIRLQVLLDPQAGPVSGDPDRLQQVVWNLLSNAIKFTPQDGRVQVRLERVNSHVEIVVSDTGKGIEPEFLPFVFERFRQSDGSMTRRHGGLGLGLAIVRQLVELHGGTVSVESEGEGHGATFTVTLPLLRVSR